MPIHEDTLIVPLIGRISVYVLDDSMHKALPRTYSKDVHISGTSPRFAEQKGTELALYEELDASKSKVLHVPGGTHAEIHFMTSLSGFYTVGSSSILQVRFQWRELNKDTEPKTNL